MTRFDFLYLVISLIIALVATDMVRSWATFIKNRAQIRFYWVHAAWSALMLFAAIQYWWGFWQYHSVENWSFFPMGALVAQTLLLALILSVITPSRRMEGNLDLQEFFYHVSPVFFSLGGAILVMLALNNFFVGDRPLLSFENAVRAIGITVTMLGATTRSVKIHTALVSTGFVLLTGFILLQVTR